MTAPHDRTNERVLAALRIVVGVFFCNVGEYKDIQSHLRHSRADTAASEYMQELPESVQQMVGTVYAMLTRNVGSDRVN